MTLRELHGVLQVAMGWEGIHLYQFILHTVCYGSWELNAESADIALNELKLRKGQRFSYEYDLNIPWEHEVRLEKRRPPKLGTYYPCCIGGGESCLPEDSGGPETWMWQRDEALGLELCEDLAMALEFMTEISETRSLAILTDPDRKDELQDLLLRIKARSDLMGQPFERKAVNTRLKHGEHLDLMHQQM